MRASRWSRFRDLALIITSVACVLLLLLLLFGQRAPLPMNGESDYVRTAQREQFVPSTTSSENSPTVKWARLSDDLRLFREKARLNRDGGQVMEDSRQLQMKYHESALSRATIRFWEGMIFNDLLRDRRAQVGALKEATHLLADADAQVGALRLKVLVALGDAHSGNSNEEAIASYREALEIPLWDQRFQKYVDELRSLHYEAARGAIVLMPKSQLVTLNLHPLVCAVMMTEYPNLKGFLTPMARDVALQRAAIKVWLLQSIKSHRSDRQLQDQLKAVLKLLLQEK